MDVLCYFLHNGVRTRARYFLLREAEVYRVAFEEEKEHNDRALKLSEIGKPKTNWKVQRVLGAWPLSLFDPWVSYPYRIFRVPERKFETAHSALS